MSIIEWAEFRLKPGVSLEQCLGASTQMQLEFLSRQTGFLHRHTVQLGSDSFADVVTWASQADAKRAMQIADAHPGCAEYFSLLQVDHPPRLAQSIWQSAPQQARLHGVEFSLFRLKTYANLEKLQLAAKRMAEKVYYGQPGFIHHQVLHKADGWYADVLLANSAERARELCNLWHEPKYQSACQSYLDLIEPSSVQMTFWQGFEH
jgi:hypothetical protein